MVKFGRSTQHSRTALGARSFVAWVASIACVLLIGILLFLAAARFLGDAFYLGYLASRGTVFDVWSALTIVEALFSLVAIAGAGFAIMRRRLLIALAFSALALPMTFVIEGSGCDTAESCRQMAWAALPASAFEWRVRLRPVTDPNEATWIAADALEKAGSRDTPFEEKRFGDHWIVSATDQDGRPGAHAVRIDIRTAETALVACPAEKIQCGMERPVVSDGRRVFRNDRLGLAAVFPAARAVCTSRSGEEPVGFHAYLRSPDVPCDVLDQSRAMGLIVAPNPRKARMVTRALTTSCRNLSSGTAELFRGQGPTFPGHPSVACELRSQGQIEISVYAFAGGPASNPDHTASPLYEAYIVTTPAYLAADVRSFEAFLQNVRIGVPKSS